MINKLHMAMIELYHGDAKRIQHFCKVHSYAKLIAEWRMWMLRPYLFWRRQQ